MSQLYIKLGGCLRDDTENYLGNRKSQTEIRDTIQLTLPSPDGFSNSLMIL